MTPLCIPFLVNLFFWGGISWWTWVLPVQYCGMGVTDGLWHSMPLKTKLLSFNCHRDPLLVPVEMNGIELQEETSFCLLDLAFTRSMDRKPYIQPIAKAVSRKVGSLYSAQRFLTPESILYLNIPTIQRCMKYCSHIWSDSPRSHGLDLPDRVQKQVSA